jgi:hypothetical protein
MHSGFKQSAGDFAVRFGGDGQANGIDLAEKSAPICGGFSLSFGGKILSARLVEVTDRNKIAEVFSSQRRVQARMLPAEMSNSDNCSS